MCESRVERIMNEFVQNPSKAIAQLELGEYESVGGSLVNNVAFIALKKLITFDEYNKNITSLLDTAPLCMCHTDEFSIEQLAPQRRKCHVVLKTQWNSNAQRSETVAAGYGLFHEWGIDYDEFEGGPGNQTVGIVELADGQIVMVRADRIKFVSDDFRMPGWDNEPI